MAKPSPSNYICIVCGAPVWAWGLCRTHHARFKRTGSTHRVSAHTSTIKPAIPGGDDSQVIRFIQKHYPHVKL